MSVVTIGLDLAKTVFQVHGVDENGHAVLRKRLSRADLLAISSINAVLSSVIVFFSSFEFASNPTRRSTAATPPGKPS